MPKIKFSEDDLTRLFSQYELTEEFSEKELTEELLETIERCKNKSQNHYENPINIILRLHDLSKQAFCTDFNIDNKTLNKALKDITKLPIKCALKINQELGYNLDWIYGLSDVQYDFEKEFHIDFRDIKLDTCETQHPDSTEPKKFCLYFHLNSNQLNLIKKYSVLNELKIKGKISDNDFNDLIILSNKSFKYHELKSDYINIPKLIYIIGNEIEP